MEKVECVVIGAGVIGLAVARALALRGREVIVLERAAAFGTETSSRNSEVIHAGIYYPPGSLKARTCIRGKKQLYEYAEARGIGYSRVGKVIVATSEGQRDRITEIQRRAEAAGVHDLKPLSRADIQTLEPEVEGVAGLFSPSTGIIDSHALMLHLLGDLESAGGTLALNTAVVGGHIGQQGIVIETCGVVGGPDRTRLEARLVVNAAGLWAQDVAAMLGTPGPIPRRHLAIGHYYALSGRSPFSHLVYPVPEPGGLGVHVTLDLAGQARFGPDVRWIAEVDYRFDDSRRSAFVDAIRRYYPSLDPSRLAPGYTGIRPKLAGPDQGFSDFRIDGPGAHGVAGLVNLYGIESPGLTAALAVADEVVRCLDVD
ncbi:MAG: NAD(P)/FAD-dependent oxidoreductase [Alphaproteobacteria bacterium]|nr:MAG: NAD(P)/FAD-dependent oxidoreductase [Alphaproteobacteria bacterium]